MDDKTGEVNLGPRVDYTSAFGQQKYRNDVMLNGASIGTAKTETIWDENGNVVGTTCYCRDMYDRVPREWPKNFITANHLLARLRKHFGDRRPVEAIVEGNMFGYAVADDVSTSPVRGTPMHDDVGKPKRVRETYADRKAREKKNKDRRRLPKAKTGRATSKPCKGKKAIADGKTHRAKL